MWTFAHKDWGLVHSQTSCLLNTVSSVDSHLTHMGLLLFTSDLSPPVICGYFKRSTLRSWVFQLSLLLGEAGEGWWHHGNSVCLLTMTQLNMSKKHYSCWPQSNAWMIRSAQQSPWKTAGYLYPRPTKKWARKPWEVTQANLNHQRGDLDPPPSLLP